jgi:Zn-dependent protease with chaperone function
VSTNKIEIPPKHSVVFFAILTLCLTGVSFVLLLGLAVACVYLPVLLVIYGSSVALQVYLLLIGGIVAAGAIVWSLFPRREKFESPGLQIDRHTQPLFFQQVDEIAAALGEKAPEEVFLTGEPGAWATQRRKAFDLRARRILVIGLPLFGLLNVSELRATLAHELAHFYSGDTRLGPWVYGAQRVLARSSNNVLEMQKMGGIHLVRLVLSLVALIIGQYFLLFLRAVRFISRKQEFRSDELACLVAGKTAAIRAITKVLGAAPTWPAYWDLLVLPVLNANRIPDIATGFSQFLGLASTIQFVNFHLTELNKAWKPNPYDTHPPFPDRIKAIESLPTDSFELDETPAYSLLSEQRLTERLFVEARNSQVPKGLLKHIEWEDVGAQITIQTWRSQVEKFGGWLQQKRAVAAPELIVELHSIGAHLPDPAGTLLTPNERAQRAADLLAVALGILLLRNGWKFGAGGYLSTLYRGDDTLNPFVMVHELVSGKTSAEDWERKCVKNGIADEILGEMKTEQSSDRSGTSEKIVKDEIAQ